MYANFGCDLLSELNCLTVSIWCQKTCIYRHLVYDRIDNLSLTLNTLGTPNDLLLAMSFHSPIKSYPDV